MQGRIEAEMKLKEKINRKLEYEPVFLKQYIYFLSDYSWVTKNNYTTDILAFFKWLKEYREADEITLDILNELLPLDINAYLSEIKYIKEEDGTIRDSSSARQTRAWSALNSFFNFLSINGFIKDNIVMKTSRPKNRDVASNKYLTQKQMKQLMKIVEKNSGGSFTQRSKKVRDILLMKIFLTTGIRVEPLREINVEDIDFKNKTVITVNKGHKTKGFELVDSVMDTLNEWIPIRAQIMGVDVEGQTGALFVSNIQTRLSYWSINNTVKYYTSQVGIEGGFSCHKLRHSYGTAIYMMTKDIEYTKEKLGHESISTTQRYINEIDKNLDVVVNNKLNAIIG
ncbi:tyrosine-type recombinase/integrase [Butyrivibrio sp. JL13D10]|uniref:tyrosine-type recombinase/integrase n=1 Tax=Butyrivibrio sp. JL13D10 TaxID=3236815 RepID=UPI0038B5CAA3